MTKNMCPRFQNRRMKHKRQSLAQGSGEGDSSSPLSEGGMCLPTGLNNNDDTSKPEETPLSTSPCCPPAQQISNDVKDEVGESQQVGKSSFTQSFTMA